MPLNLTLLRSFVSVADAGSVTAAARDGFISQPALSKAVRELEKQVGMPLLERTARGVVLTEAGRELLEHGHALFAIERTAEEALLTHRTLAGGTLRIGASTTLSTYVLPPLLGEFRERHPGLILKLQRGNTHEVERALCAYEIDVALVEGPTHDERIEARVWRTEELVCVCAAGHPLAAREKMHPRALKTENWITREPGSGTREVVQQLLAPYGLPPADALEIGGAEALKQTVAVGLGIGVVSREAAADQLALGKLQTIALTEPVMERPFYWLELRGRPAAPATRAFRHFLYDECLK